MAHRSLVWVRVVTSHSLAAKCNIVYGTPARDVSMNRGPGNNEEKRLKIDNKLLFSFCTRPRNNGSF